MEGGIFVVDVHIVQRGDTLWKISRQYGISFEDLKRVNAHLANPDYIVPGMKIFIPEKKQKVEEPKQPDITKGQTKEKQVEKGEQVKRKEPEKVKKPVQPKQEVPVPKEPIPLPSAPKAPTITSKPVEQPRPPQVEKPKEKPVQPEPEQQWQTPPPPAHGGQPPQQPQMTPVQPYPIIGIPCGWFPIYDADCYPHLHPRQMQPMQPMPPMTQLPVHEHHNFRPSRPESRPIQHEQHKKQNLPKQEDKKVKPTPLQPKLQESILTVPTRMPDIEEPAGKKPVKVPQEKPVVPQTHEAPYPQFQEPLPQQNWPYNMQQPHPVHAGQTSPYGYNQFEPMYMYPQQMPMQPHPFCQSCNQPVFHPMPNQWPGT